MVTESAAPKLVAAFYDPLNGFAGTTFDDLPDNRPNEITAGDLLAVSLLDVAIPPAAVREILGPLAAELTERLHAVPVDLDLWEADDEHLRRARELWDGLSGLWGVGPTRKSKLLARKRPRLIPIMDKVIKQALPLGDDTWVSLRGVLRDDKSLCSAIEDLRPPDVDPEVVTTLRLLDTVVWMRFSEGRSARTARQKANLPLAALPAR